MLSPNASHAAFVEIQATCGVHSKESSSAREIPSAVILTGIPGFLYYFISNIPNDFRGTVQCIPHFPLVRPILSN